MEEKIQKKAVHSESPTEDVSKQKNDGRVPVSHRNQMVIYI